MPRNMPPCKSCGHPEGVHENYTGAYTVGFWFWKRQVCERYVLELPKKPAPPPAPPTKIATLRLVFSILALLLLPANFSVAGEEKPAPSPYFEYTQDNGTKAFTDKLEKIAAKYRDSAKQVAWAELTAKTDKKYTVADSAAVNAAVAKMRRPLVAPDAPKPEDECTGVPTFDYHYKTVEVEGVGTLTRVFYRMFDACGTLVGEFPFQPPYSYMEPKYEQYPRPRR